MAEAKEIRSSQRVEADHPQLGAIFMTPAGRKDSGCRLDAVLIEAHIGGGCRRMRAWRWVFLWLRLRHAVMRTAGVASAIRIHPTSLRR